MLTILLASNVIIVFGIAGILSYFTEAVSANLVGSVTSLSIFHARFSSGVMKQVGVDFCNTSKRVDECRWMLKTWQLATVLLHGSQMIDVQKGGVAVD